MQDKIDEIMDYFDFERVEKVMKSLEWNWYNIGVPDIYCIKKFARKLLREACESKKSLGCGGFKVTYYKDGNLGLEFIVTEWHTEDE